MSERLTASVHAPTLGQRSLQSRQNVSVRARASKQSIVGSGVLKGQLPFKPPKTKAGKRTLVLPAGAVAVLRQHRARQGETRLALGLGAPDAGDSCSAAMTGTASRARSRPTISAGIGPGL